MAAGLVTSMPKTAEEAKKLGEEVITTKGGEMLSKLSGTLSCAIEGSRQKCPCMCVCALTGGLVTTVPISVDDAKRMGEDLIAEKGGELISKLSGT